MTAVRIAALSGGVGGAKLALGLDRVLAAGELLVVVNTGDDFEHLGLSISPDIDSVIYALAACENPVMGWGRADETWTFMAALEELGGPVWFRLGDKDLAVHTLRTASLRAGVSLSEVTGEIARRFGIATQVLPMSDDPVRTRLLTREGWIDFQEYFVKRRCEPAVHELSYEGASGAKAAPGLSETLRAELDAILICPSNPYLSIDPILAIPEIRSALESATVPVVAVSPIIGGHAVKGPTAKIMSELGLECSVEAVAQHYGELIDGFVIDERDRASAAAIETMGIASGVTNTLMTSLSDRCALANWLLGFAEALRR